MEVAEKRKYKITNKYEEKKNTNIKATAENSTFATKGKTMPCKMESAIFKSPMPLNILRGSFVIIQIYES